MEKLLNNFSLAARISVLALIPLLTALGFAISAFLTTANTYSEARSLNTLAEYAPTISNLVHELQKERGRSAGYIGSKGAGQSRDLMNTQRSNTDVKLQIFQTDTNNFDKKSYGKNFEILVNKTQQSLSNLQKKRSDVANLKLSVGQMAGYYTETIANLLHIIKSMAVISKNADISKSIISYIGLLEQKERAGLERAMGNNGFSQNTFPTPIYNRFVGLIQAQNAFMATFKDYSSPDVLAVYNNTVTGSPVQQVQKMRDHVQETRGAITNTEFTNTVWFTAITDKINLLKKVEDFANQTILHKTQNLATICFTRLIYTIILSILGTILLLVACFIIYKSISRPLTALQNSMASLAAGDLETHVPYIEFSSEIGRMAKSVYAFKQNVRERQKLEDKAMQEATAKRELEEKQRVQQEEEQAKRHKEEMEAARLQEEKMQHMETLTGNFDTSVNQALDALLLAAQDLDTTANDMVKQAEGNEVESSAAASAAEQTNTNVQTVASAAEELSSSIKEISRQVAESSQKSDNAVTEISKATDTVHKLQTSSQKVGEVINLINDIAEQTNLLALNATIEAARAGDAGKGFAVVAHEVKALADQTASATEDISRHVKNIQDVSNNVTTVVETIKTVIEETNQISSAIAAAVEEQGAATQEISRSVQEAHQGTEVVSERIETVQTIAGKTRSSSSSVQQSSSSLSRYNEELKKLVQSFLVEVKNI